MKRILIAGSAFALITAPAHAQLLGGGGLGGALGGGVGGTLGGAGSIGRLPLDTHRGTASGTLGSSGNASSSAHANRHSGHVDANGQGNASVLGTLDSNAASPSRSTGAHVSGGGSTSAGGTASAQLMGTDGVRNIAGPLIGQARGTGQAAAQQGQGTVQGLLDGGVAPPSTAQGNGSAAAFGSGSSSFSPLAAAGSLAAQAQGAFAVQNGTSILGADGDSIGKVARVMADAQGHVQQVLVSVDGQRALLPAGVFQASGRGLVSAMGEGQIKQAARQQEQAQ